MISRQVPKPALLPPDTAISAKCGNCMIQFFAHVSDMKKEPIMTAFDTWVWVIDCPKCSQMIGFKEYFAEELKNDPTLEVPLGLDPVRS